MVVTSILGFTACSNQDNAVGPVQEEKSTIQEIADEALGTWTKGFLTNQGVFLTKDSSTPSSSTDGTTDNTKKMYFSSKDGSAKAMLLINNEDNRPLQLILNDGVLNFSFLNDEVLELVFKNGSDITYIDQISYNKAALDAALEAALYNNDLQKSLFYFTKVTDISKLGDYPSVVAVVKYLSEIFGFDFDASSILTAVEAGLNVESDGIATIAKEADEFESNLAKKVYSTITVWTGMASFKVGGSSCTLSGTIFCTDPSFAEVGTFGIVCDQDKEKLFIGQAEFEGEATLKDDQNFDVDFRGFKPTTTYYYRAFYKFKDGVAYGDLLLDPTQVAADSVAYDNVIKDFTTGEYKYTVDVVMLMDISGSMSDEINMVKRNANNFYSLFKGKCDAKGIDLLGLTTQVVTFSDINVDGKAALNKSIVYNMENEEEHNAYEAYVNSISLAYGGDDPESGLEALATAFTREDWGPDDGLHRQIFILWTDATYKTVNEGICKKLEYDAEGNAVYTPMYTEFSFNQVKDMWNGLSSGRRLILFAPFGSSGYSNEGDWALMDEWKNVYHEITSYNFNKSLDYIIEEMISKEKTTDSGSSVKAFRPKYVPQPNK